MRLLLALLLILAAIPGCGPCRGLATGVNGVNGDISYTTEEGTTLHTTRADLWGESPTSVDIRAQIGDRPVQILIEGLTSGKTTTLAHDEAGKACLPVQGGAAPTCLLLDGTVDVRTLQFYDCAGNENITTCSEDIDLTIHATSKDRGLALTIELHVVGTARTGRCEAE